MMDSVLVFMMLDYRLPENKLLDVTVCPRLWSCGKLYFLKIKLLFVYLRIHRFVVQGCCFEQLFRKCRKIPREESVVKVVFSKAVVS